MRLIEKLRNLVRPSELRHRVDPSRPLQESIVRERFSITRTRLTQPIFEHRQTEEELVMVVSARAVVREQLPHRFRLQQVEHQRAVVQQRVRQRTCRWGLEPLVDYIHGKTAFLAIEHCRGQHVLAEATMQPFAPASTNLQSRPETLRELDNRAIQVRHANFETVRHGELVAKHQQLVGKRGANLEMLKTAQIVEMFHLWQQLRPMCDLDLIVTVRQYAIPKQAVDCCLRGEREHMLITVQAMVYAQRVPHHA